jgi:ABC-2 type transport system permease protein
VIVRWEIFRVAVMSGIADFRTIYTWRTWLAGWLLRVLFQVAFFALIGRLLDSPETTRYLLVGNAASIAAVEACFVCASTVWERQTGSLPLLVAAPASPLIAFAGRSVFWLGSGTVSASIALFALAPVFSVDLPLARTPLAVLAIVVVGVSVYCFALVLAGFVLRAPEMRNIAGNVAHLSLAVLCGVQVPVTYWPEPVQVVASVLPMNHGLAALRALLDGEPLAGACWSLLLECAVAAAWFGVAALTFNRFVEGGRRSGSIEFGT